MQKSPLELHKIKDMPESRDFATPLHVNTSVQRPSHIDLEAQSSAVQSEKHPIVLPKSPAESIRHRRPTRSNTAKTYRPEGRGAPWQPGQEPGIDTSEHPNDRLSLRHLELHEECEITVVDFSQDHIQMQRLDNKTLVTFIAQRRPAWTVCRWISVNGISWDVIKVLGNYKGLHRLAIEDLISPTNRTKADWYSDHTYSELR